MTQPDPQHARERQMAMLVEAVDQLNAALVAARDAGCYMDIAVKHESTTSGYPLVTVWAAELPRPERPSSREVKRF